MKLVDEKKKIKLTPSQALLKAANFCAYQERSHHEVTQRLAEWGIYGIDAQEILLQLIEQNYLNEERFAIAFAGGKFRVKQWGRVKIKLELKQHKVSDYCINKALSEIDDDAYMKMLEEELIQKWNKTKDANILSKRAKVARYLLSRGFEQDLIWDMLKNKNG